MVDKGLTRMYAPQAGNSNGDQRMDLLDRFYDIFPDAQVAYLISSADNYFK